MAHVTLIIDRDRERRSACAGEVRGLLAQIPGAMAGEVHAADASCLWVSGPRAPTDVMRCIGGFAVLIGYAVDDDGTWIGASRIAGQWLGPRAQREAYDGYYIGIAYDEHRGCAVRVDPLGLFPLYYAEPSLGTIVVTTTPAAFACHPQFEWQVDRLGLAGILLANGILRNRPLVAGTRRLALGHQLSWNAGEAAREVEVFRLPEVANPPDESFDEMCDRISGELVCAMRRHRPQGDDTLLMLSGGLDSRLVAALLVGGGVPTRCVTLGRAADLEVRAAMEVALRLNLPVEAVSHEASPSEFVRAARRAARLACLSAAPSSDDLAAGLAAASTRACYFWSGIPFDWVFEPVSRHCGFDIERGTWSCEELVAHVPAWGVPLKQLPSLLGPAGRDLCGEVIREIREQCTAGPYPVDRQSALFRWEQRVRGHLAASLHQMSFAAWPLMISTDRRLFSAIQWLPHCAYPERRMEHRILVRCRPDMAGVPLDTNSFAFEPVGGRRHGTLNAAIRSVGRRLRRAVQPLAPSLDVRRYERLFNVDHPRWIAVRQDAERLRPGVEQLLDPGALSTVWPSPRRRLRSRKPIEAGAAIRLITGLAYALDR